MLLWHKLLMDKADDDGSPSGYGSTTSTTTEATTTTQEAGDSGDGSAASSTDTSGAANQAAAADDKSKQTTTEDVTGYTGKDNKGDAKETAVTDDKPLELDLKGLAEDSVKDIQEFAKTHGLTKEQAQGLVDKRKADEDAKVSNKEAYKAEEVKVFQKWETELKDDPDFGGQNFAQSVHNVNKLIREELPGIKNLLTSSGKRLPPSVMKDLNNVARKLYGETELVQGSNSGTKDGWKPTDFYKTKT